MSAGYGMMRGKSALNLAFRASTSICRQLVGKQDAPHLRYELALFLLVTLEGYPIKGENLEENIQGIKEEAHGMADDVDGDPYSELAKDSFVIVDEVEE